MRVIALLVVLPACLVIWEPPVEVEGNPTNIVDSSGAGFGWICNAAGTDCSVELDGDTPPLPECRTGQSSYAWSYGRFVSVLAVCNHETGGWSSSGNLSRPVACTDDVECPQFKGSEGPRRFECRSGLCQRSDITSFPPTFINSSDASNLCYARFARVDTFGPLNPIGQQVSDRVNSVCPSNFSSVPCTLPLPDGCMQP